MKRIFLTFAALLFLAGCGTLGTVITPINNPIKLKQVYELEAAYGVLQGLARAYVRLELCPKGVTSTLNNPCSDARAVVKIGKADVVARKALDKVETFVRDNPKLSALKLIGEAQAAIGSFQEIQAIYNIN